MERNAQLVKNFGIYMSVPLEHRSGPVRESKTLLGRDALGDRIQGADLNVDGSNFQSISHHETLKSHHSILPWM